MRNACLCVHRLEIEDRHTCRLAAGAGGGGNRDEWLQTTGHRLATPDRRVYVRQEVGWIGGIQIRCLGGVHARATAQSDVAVELALAGKADGVLERSVGRLDADLVV